MVTFLSILLFIVCVLLILLVLIQDSKGGGMGVMGGGGGSSTVWGATGAASFLEKLTRVIAILFFVMSFILAWEAGKKSDSVVDNMPVPAAAATDDLVPAAKDSETVPTEAANGLGTESPSKEKEQRK
jgi:preprotein translocase subunit SecG